jgi:RTX calcium-binding nonapeptide repeat (4 copies)
VSGSWSDGVRTRRRSRSRLARVAGGVALAGIALTALPPGSSHAAGVGYEQESLVGGTVGGPGLPLRFQAADGERNRVTVGISDEAEYLVEDRGAALTAGTGCRQTEDPQVVLCRRDIPEGFGGVEVFLGDLDDTARVLRGGGGLVGGPGNDTLVGGPGADLVMGGTGDDTLVGGPGEDDVHGGPGIDALRGGRGADQLDGAGFMAGEDSGSLVELDNDVSGGPGHDFLRGAARDDRLRGDGGNDALFDGGLFGGSVIRADADLFRGGPGLDLVAYEIRDRPFAPRVAVTFDGRPNDGPRRADDFAGDLERVYSLAIGKRCRRLPSGLRRCAIGGYRITDRPGPNGERLRPVGAVSLRTYRLSRRGTAQAVSGVFETLSSGGEFRLSEGRSPTDPTVISLPKGGFGRCRADARAAAQAPRRPISRVRGRTGRRYGGVGRHSSATVRGTDWSITERCDGTFTEVHRGTVLVRDFRRRRTIVLTAGESYLARAPG